MKKSEWSDNELEQLLRQMPKIKDHRDPHDIYQSLSTKVKKRKRPVWIIPSVASVAAVLLLFLIAPNIWQGMNRDADMKMENMALDDQSGNTEISRKVPDDTEQSTSFDTGDNMGITAIETVVSETALYEEDIAMDQETLTYWMPDQNAQIIVPVSVLVPKENKSWLELFNAYSDKLTESQWGLSEYYPLNATFSMVDDRTVNVDVPEGHAYGNGSASETSFLNIIKQTMRDKGTIQKVTLSTNGKPGIMFGNFGEKTEIDLSEPEGRHSYYLFNPNNSNLPFLVPSTTLYSDIEAAFASMFTNKEENYGLISPLSFNFTINSKSQTHLVLSIEDNIQITNEPKFIYAIEAILLTAKEFGFKTVKFENTSAEQIGRFNLQNELKVPVAPNKVLLQ